MKQTNNYNLPSVFEGFEKANPYSSEGSDFSATTLIDAPQAKRLFAKHSGDLTEDISERAFSILGTAVHKILEDGASENQKAEERLFTTIETPEGEVSVSGQIDLQTIFPEGRLLSDYKTTSIWSYRDWASDKGKPEWVKQLNVYQALAVLNGIDVIGLEVIAIFRDWTSGGVDRFEIYPESPIMRLNIPMWEPEEAVNYLKERTALHKSPDIPGCTDEERWAKPPVFAVHEMLSNGKGLKKRATKLFEDELEANIFSADREGSEVIERPRVFTRCEGNYCKVAQFCSQYSSDIEEI